jgi:energy-coupling factor transporter ATP-binding protein EcfA2
LDEHEEAEGLKVRARELGLLINEDVAHVIRSGLHGHEAIPDKPAALRAIMDEAPPYEPNGHDPDPPPADPADYGDPEAKWAPGSPWNPENLGAAELPKPPPILSKRQFVEGFVPPDHLIDGMLQRGYVYGLTGQTGHGKSAIALLIAGLVGRPSGDAHFGRHAVDRGNVIYFAGENPDDLRIRVKGADAIGGRDDALDDNISFIPGVFSIPEMRAVIEAEAIRLGGVILVIIDTSAAYFFGNDEQSNTQLGAHARTLRTLTTLLGHPTVLVLCHPIKHVSDPTQLLPRGGGAFLAELDGNLTAWLKDGSLVELWHNKMRGPGFEPMTFRLEKVTTTALTDSKGRLIPTVRAVPVTEYEEETEARVARTDEDELLIAMLEPGRSVAQLATACGWTMQNGSAYKSKVQRVMARLARSGLVKNHRETWQLSDAGKPAANAAKSTSDAGEHQAKRYGE